VEGHSRPGIRDGISYLDGCCDADGMSRGALVRISLHLWTLMMDDWFEWTLMDDKISVQFSSVQFRWTIGLNGR
jgi:hypothetical protein